MKSSFGAYKCVVGYLRHTETKEGADYFHHLILRDICNQNPSWFDTGRFLHSILNFISECIAWLWRERVKVWRRKKREKKKFLTIPSARSLFLCFPCAKSDWIRGSDIHYKTTLHCTIRLYPKLRGYMYVCAICSIYGLLYTVHDITSLLSVVYTGFWNGDVCNFIRFCASPMISF